MSNDIQICTLSLFFKSNDLPLFIINIIISQMTYLKLINMRELSELLTGDRRAIQMKQIPTAYKDKMDELERLLKSWHEPAKKYDSEPLSPKTMTLIGEKIKLKELVKEDDLIKKDKPVNSIEPTDEQRSGFYLYVKGEAGDLRYCATHKLYRAKKLGTTENYYFTTLQDAKNHLRN